MDFCKNRGFLFTFEGASYVETADFCLYGALV